MSPEEVRTRLAAGSVALIDVRTPAEFRDVHADGATLMPLDELDPKALDATRPVALICESGTRAEKAAGKLRAAGFPDVVVVDGGTRRWMEVGLPVVRGRKSISVLRQVRMLAGSLVLVGVGLGWFVHPAGYGLSAFIGAGLVFSGLTDSCGMGWCLSKMPWNR